MCLTLPMAEACTTMEWRLTSPLCNEKGDTLDMGTKVDYFGKAAHIDNEAQLVDSKRISKTALKNRELLRKVMRHAGWRPLRTEWWHFNLCSRATAKKYYKVIK